MIIDFNNQTVDGKPTTTILEFIRIVKRELDKGRVVMTNTGKRVPYLVIRGGETGGRITATFDGQVLRGRMTDDGRRMETTDGQATTSDRRTTLTVEEQVTMNDERTTTSDGQVATTIQVGSMTTDEQMTAMTDGQVMTIDEQMRMMTDEPTEVAAIEEVIVSGDLGESEEQLIMVTAAEQETVVVEVDPLAFVSPSSGTPVRPASCTTATPRSLFFSPEESIPSVSGLGHDMLVESGGVDADGDTVVRGQRVVGRRQVVVEEDDVETRSSMSATSTGGDSVTAFSSRAKRKGTKRNREALKGKDCRKEGKAEGSNEGNQKKGKGKKKDMGKKETLEVVESDGRGGESMDVMEHSLEGMSSSVLGGAVMEWASRIEEIRAKSKNFQGRLSGEIKRCIIKIKEGTSLLVTRSEATGDSHFARLRNSELIAQLREAERENALLREQLRKSPGLSSPPRKKKAGKAVTTDVLQVGPDDLVDPFAREEFPPLPQRLPRGGKVQDGGREKAGPSIVSNVQVAPPFKECCNAEAAIPAVSGSEAEWRVAAGSRRRGRVKGDDPPPPPPVPVEGRPPVRQQQSRVRLPRPPVSSAVTITGRTEDFSYAEAMKSARQHINLENLGITTSRVRKALNGGLLIEVSGDDSRTKAEKLVTELRSVLKDSAAVSCPTKKRELSVIGFDESVTTDEIAEALSSIGGCPKADIRMGPIRTMYNGLGRVWVQLPVAAAAKVAEEGRVRAGWTMARVELLKVRPLQCFKCWAFGHAQNVCRNVADRRGACFRCGQKGHLSSTCRNDVHCAFCYDAGLEATHRLGDPQCAAHERQGEREVGGGLRQ